MSADQSGRGNSLRCTFCGGEITPILEYTSGSYSEHRDHNGYECDDCPATWDKRGNVTTEGTGPCVCGLPTCGPRMADSERCFRCIMSDCTDAPRKTAGVSDA